MIQPGEFVGWTVKHASCLTRINVFSAVVHADLHLQKYVRLLRRSDALQLLHFVCLKCAVVATLIALLLYYYYYYLDIAFVAGTQP